MHRLHRVLCGMVVAVALSPSVSRSQAVLIDDNFETDTSASYTIATSDAANGSVTFAFDYVAAGIPLAPRSTPGDTNGLKIAVNTVSGAVNSQTAFNNTAINEDKYTMLVDVFMAFQGATATTIYGQPGVGGNGTTFNAIFTPISGSGSFMAFTGDGGSASDYRWYLSSANGGPTTVANTDPSYLGHGSNNTGAFYTSMFPSPPATFAGVPGNIWTTVRIDVDNTAGRIQYYMTDTAGNPQLVFDNNPNPLTPTPFTGLLQGLVSLGAHDAFASLSPASVFVVYDNLQVVPEPSAILMGVAGLGGVSALGLRRRARARRQG
jgi:hypothetical protein